MVVVNVLLLVFFHVLVTGMFLDLSFWNWIGVIILALFNNYIEDESSSLELLTEVPSFVLKHYVG